jgi:HSP20 family molecular chaperone IbpA
MTFSLIKRPFDSVFFDDLFNLDSRHQPELTRRNTTTDLKVDISETDHAYTLEAHVPGFTDDEIKVKLEKDILILTAKKTSTEEEKNKNYLRKEISTSEVSRSFKFPSIVNSNKLDATLKHGVLKVILPKDENKETREIPVRFS